MDGLFHRINDVIRNDVIRVISSVFDTLKGPWGTTAWESMGLG